MSRVLRTTFPLYRTQAEFRHCPALYRGFVGGRGAGKSKVGAYDLIRRAKRGRLYLVAAPTYPMLSDSTFRSFLEVARGLRVVTPDGIRRSPPAVALSTGAEVLFRSADDPERLRGPNLSGAWLDEASLMAVEAYQIVIGTLREAGEQGWLSATFTPKGRTHWTYDVFGRGRPDTRLFKARTRDNPFNPPGFEQTLASQYGDGSRLAEQELGGEFVDWSGGVFRGPWFRLVAESQRIAARVRYWDKAATEGGGAYTAGVLCAKAVTGRFAFEDVVRGQWSALERDRVILQTAQFDKQRYGSVIQVIEQEPGSGGKESAEATVRQLAGFVVRLDKVTDPKGERYMPLASQAEAGNVDVLDRPWAPAFIEELAAVPEGKYKDQADAAAGAFAHVSLMHAGGGGLGLPAAGQQTMTPVSEDAYR